MKLINKQEIFDKWAPVIEESTGLDSKLNRDKVKWIAEYSHYHSVNEASSATVTNTPGMGDIRFPGNPGSQQSFVNQERGSGDNPASLLPLSMQVAAQTVGLDMLPVVPMDRPLTTLTYVDSIYADGKLNGSGKDAPSMIKIPIKSSVEDVLAVNNVSIGAEVSVGDHTSAALARIGTYIGRSRIDGYPIVKLDQDLSDSPSNLISADVDITIGSVVNGGTYDSTSPVSGNGTDGISGKADFVKALEDHITGFSGKYFETMNSEDFNMPQEREMGEETNTRSLGFKFYNKSVSAKTFDADVAVTREQLQDSKQFGIDLMSMANTVLANETSQGMNKNILERAFALGATNHEQIRKSLGVHFNINFDSDVASGDPISFELGIGRDGTPITQTLTGAQAPMAKAATGGETLLTAQRRILDQILAAGNIISQRGRRGPASVAVTNTHVATVLQTISGFQAAPMSNTFNQNNGSLSPLGSIAGISFFVDPNMDWHDTRICIWRKGDAQSPGLIMMPYMMAESVETIAENTMAPKIQVKSRYALAEAGHNPHVYFLTLKVKTTGGLLR